MYQGARLAGGEAPRTARRRGAEAAGRGGGAGARGERGANPRGRERGAEAGERGANPNRAASRTSPNARPRERGANPNRPASEHRTAQRGANPNHRTHTRPRHAQPTAKQPWVYRFSFRARRKRGADFSTPHDRITDKSMCPRALNQTALESLPSVALSSVG